MNSHTRDTDPRASDDNVLEISKPMSAEAFGDTSGEICDQELIFTPCCGKWTDVRMYEDTKEKTNACSECGKSIPKYIYRFGDYDAAAKQMTSPSESIETSQSPRQRVSLDPPSSTASNVDSFSKADMSDTNISYHGNNEATGGCRGCIPHEGPDVAAILGFLLSLRNRFLEAVSLFEDQLSRQTKKAIAVELLDHLGGMQDVKSREDSDLQLLVSDMFTFKEIDGQHSPSSADGTPSPRRA